MHRPTLAGPRRRTRRALLAAALPAMIAAVALPSAAGAATAEVINASTNGVIGYSAAAGEANNVRVTVANGKLVISDQAPIVARDGCTLNAAGDAECPIGVDSVAMVLRDRNDVVQYAAPHFGSVSGEDGNDEFLAGVRQAVPGRAIQNVHYFGNAGHDTVSYRFADRGVTVDLGAGVANNGRPGIDREFINTDFEIIEGSNFDDPQLFGSDRNEVFSGLDGDDVIGTGGGRDIIQEGSAPNGADFLNGGNGPDDTVSYGPRTSAVDVFMDGQANDGAPGEGDHVRPSVENVVGTNHADVLTGNDLGNELVGLGGDDRIDGREGDDEIVGGAGVNSLFGRGGDDFLQTRNGRRDIVDCGAETPSGVDRFDVDSTEQIIHDCERRAVGIGTLRLAPRTVAADAGDTARLRLSWRHPVGWRKLRKLELRLIRDGLPVGEVTIRPQSERISADGAVQLVRERGGLTRDGKTVAVRLALKLDESLAGQTVKVEVEASDRRGRRQLERDAGAIRVAG